MHHIQCTVNENKNMNILFHFRQELGTCAECKPTSIAPRFETALREARVGKCSGFNTRRRSRPDIFGLKLNGESLTLLNLIGVIPHAHWLASCIKSTRMSHWPSYHNTTVVLCVCTLLRNRLAQVKHWKNEVKVEESASSPPSMLRSKASPSWNLTSPGTKMARLPYRRDVTVLLWRVFRFAAITVSRSRMLATDASFFSVISTASRWDLRLWRQWGEGMWAYVSIEPAVFNFVRHRAHCNAGLLFFLRCLRPVKIQRHVADDFWQHYWPTRPDDVKIGDAEQSFDSGWRVVFIKLFYLYNLLR